MVKIILDLTDDQIEKLQEFLMFYYDRGPVGEGWQSKELIDIREIVDEAVAHPQYADLMQRVVGFLQWVHNDATRRAAPFYVPYSEASILSAEQETWNMAQDAKKLISDIAKTFNLDNKVEG